MTAPSDHFDGTRYFNPGGANGVPFRNVPRLLFAKRTPWPREIAVAQRTPPALARNDAAVITFIGHSTFLIQTHCGNILIDPIYARRAGPFGVLGPRRVRAPGVALHALPPISLVLLSHNHYDHCDVVALATIARRDSPMFVTASGNAALLVRCGARRITELDWWDRTTVAGATVTATPAQHFSARTPFDRNRALWCGFVIETGRARVYFAGDTGFMPYFGDIRERCGAISSALLPIGAYEPRWFMKDIHMNPEEAVAAHVELGARQSIACHWGTFQLTPEGIDDPPNRLRAALRARGIPENDFQTPDVGESLHVSP